MQDEFLFFRNYLHTIQEAPKSKRGQLCLAIVEYILDDKEPTFKPSDWGLRASFEAMRLAFNTSKDLHKKRSEAGKLGGAPKGNQNAVKPKTSKTSKKQAKTSEEEKEVLYVNNNKNILYYLTEKKRAKYFPHQQRQILLSESYSYHEKDRFGSAMLEVADTLLELQEIVQKEPVKFNNQTYNEEDINKIFSTIGKQCVELIAGKIAVKRDIENRTLYILGVVFSQYEKIKRKEFVNYENKI